MRFQSAPLCFASLLVAVLALAAPSSSAQSAALALRLGDDIPGVGEVDDINEAVVNDSGEWLVFAGTDNEDDTIDTVIVRNGFLTLQEGTTLGNPPGAKIDAFRSLNIDSRGDSGWELRLRDAPTLYGCFYNTRLVLLETEPVPEPPFSSGSTYLAFNKITRYNDNWQILLLCSVADSTLPGFADDALVLLSTDGNGTLTDQKVLAFEGGMLPDQTQTVRALTGNRNSFAINDSGQAMFLVRMNGPTSADYAVYIDDERIAQENTNSPQAGRRFESLAGARVDLNDRGDYVFDANLTGSTSSDTVIFKNDRIIAREGGTAPGGVFQNFGSGTPIQITDAGDVVFYANWTGATARDEGILFNGIPIVREGVTPVGSDVVVTLKNSAESFNISPNGRYLIFIGTTEDPISGVLVEGSFLVDIGGVEILDGCFDNVPSLRRVDGFPVLGGTLTLAMDDAQSQGAIALLMVSDRLVPGAPPCGLQIPSGELLIDFGQNGNPLDAFLGTSWVGSPVEIDVPIPMLAGLTDLSLYLQGFFFDPVGTASMRIALTNGLRIEIGAP